MKILINKHCAKEKEYIINILFGVFLGLEYEVEYHNSNDYIINLNNRKTIIIKESFFNKFESELGYLRLKNIPTGINYLNSQFNNEPVISLFGQNEVIINDNNITINADIFASTFFMLTRWEESVNKIRDKHNRFPAEESLAYKFNFLEKPIVNEYVELLWNILIHLGYKGKRKSRKFEMILTHDVDLPRLWWNLKGFIKSLASSLIKRKSIKGFLNLLKFKLNNQDPFDTFNHLMTVSESNNIKSHFFFMSGGTSNKDNFYKIDHPKIIQLISEIKKRGHHVGFHPSYNAYNDHKQFNKELELLKATSKSLIETGREHFLRFEVPTTWQIWEDHHMKWDSTMSYHNKSGFRCGVCYEFPVFNILTRQQLKLIEKPLIVMEGSFLTYQNISPTKMEEEINLLIDQVKKYNGNFVFLWHNSAFNIGKSKKYQHLYKKIVDQN